MQHHRRSRGPLREVALPNVKVATITGKSVTTENVVGFVNEA